MNKEKDESQEEYIWLFLTNKNQSSLQLTTPSCILKSTEMRTVVETEKDVSKNKIKKLKKQNDDPLNEKRNVCF